MQHRLKVAQSTRYKHQGAGMWQATCSCGDYSSSYYVDRKDADRAGFRHVQQKGKK